MSSIWEMTSAALTGLGVSMAAGAYLMATPGGNLPDQYITYQLVDMSPLQHADNEETLRDELVQVTVRSRSGLAGLPDVIGAMTAAGFMFSNGRELEYDPEGRHFGIAFDFDYVRDLGS